MINGMSISNASLNLCANFVFQGRLKVKRLIMDFRGFNGAVVDY